MIIEKIKKHLDDLSKSEKRENKNLLRASSSGKCTRAIAYSYHGFEGTSLNWRAQLVFKIGHHTEADLQEIAKLYGLDDFQKECSIKINDVEIIGHVDGIWDKTHVVDFKTTTTYGFKEAKKGIVGDYLYQMNFYMKALGLKHAILVYYCKETSDLHEVHLDFDELAWGRIKTKFEKVLSSTKESLPAKDYAPNEKGVLPWQCSYCSFNKHCFPDFELTFNDSGKPQLTKKQNGGYYENNETL